MTLGRVITRFMYACIETGINVLGGGQLDAVRQATAQHGQIKVKTKSGLTLVVLYRPNLQSILQ